jgi:hypothetical protein
MALTADREYGCINPDDICKGVGGAADTLYKGAIISLGTNGLLKVAAAVGSEVPIGLCKKQVVCAGANAEEIEVDRGVLAVAKKSQHTTTILCGTGGASNVNYANKYFTIYGGSTGATKYCVWCNVDSAGTDPTIAAPTLGTAIEIAVGTADSTSTIAETIAHALDAIGGANVTWDADHSTATVTAVNANRGANGVSVAGDAVFTVTNTVYGNAVQSDVGKLFYAIADDGVVLTAAKGSADVAFGRCIDLVGAYNELWINTHEKA